MAHDYDGQKITFEEFEKELHSWFFIADFVNVLVKNLTPFIIGIIFLSLFQYFGKESEE